MTDRPDTAQVLVRPPLALALDIAAGIALDWFAPVQLLPANFPSGWAGGLVIVFAVGLFAWAIVTMTRAGTSVPTNQPTTAIVEAGPYRFTRNPIYLAMAGLILGLAILLNTAWLLLMLAVFALVVHYRVIAREEAYLERKFGQQYRDYRARVRRWL
jgi:protein-S-isoprenylcysteine O-methyltransferase Ste14